VAPRPLPRLALALLALASLRAAAAPPAASQSALPGAPAQPAAGDVRRGAPAPVGEVPPALDALGDGDLRVVERAVAAIVAAPRDADLLFAAARACEDRLADPGRALAIYQRIVAAYPDARVANAAARRITELRPLVGAAGEHARLAAELAYLTAHADDEPAASVLARGAALSEARWPGAPRAALWLADWLRRAGRLLEAQARYAAVAARWPDTPAAHDALRGAASTALDARNWPLADALVRRLPAAEPADRGVHDDLARAVARGALRHRAYVASWLALLACTLALLASLAHTARRSAAGDRLSALRPPIEVIFLAPIAAVLIGVAFTAHRLIAPAVATITLGGTALTYLSGATLQRLRELHRPTRLRIFVHLPLCLLGILALSYIALARDNLLDLLLETVRFGPET
jgi:hypothetical protein